MGLSRKQAAALGIPDSAFPAQARGKAAHVRFAMNRTEGKFSEHLEGRRLAGEIKGWSFEADTFLLTPDMQYTPDFVVEMLDGSYECVDVKGGHVWEDSIVKAKAAAALFPWRRWYLARWQPDRVRRRRVRAPRGQAGQPRYTETIEPGHWALRRMGVARGAKQADTGETTC